MYKLYHGAGSCSLAVKAALALTGVEARTHVMDMAGGEHQQAPYRRISAQGKVPALERQDGSVLTEGAAILLYLDARFPEARLMPEAGTVAHGEALMWLQRLYATVHPHWARAFFPERYGQDANSIHAVASAELHTLYAAIDEQLSRSPYIAGEQLTLGDLYLMVSIFWERVLSTSLSGQYPHLAAYRQRIFEQPVIGELYREELAG